MNSRKAKNGTLLILVLLMLLPAWSWAQSTLKGFVREKESGEPIPFVLVKSTDGTYGARANEEGYYSIPKINGESIELRVSATGYAPLDTAIALSGGIQTVNFILDFKYNKTKEVIVSAKRQEKQKEVNIGVTKIDPTDIKSIPSVGGEPDLAQYLQLTPGVVNTGDQGGQLFIRGGSPVQNKILLDGMTIYNPFHSIGIYSVFETDLIRNSYIITGAFNARYGDRTSSIVDINTKDGNKNRLSGKLGVSPIMSRLMLEGPLSRNNGEPSNSTFVLSAKYSYLDRTSKSLYGGLSGVDPDVGLPYSFSDLYAKLTFGSNTGSKFSFFGFNFNDKNEFPRIPSYQWNSYGGGANILVTPSSSSMFITGKLSFSNYSISSLDGSKYPRHSEIGGFEGGLDFSYFLPNYGELKYGFEIQGFQTDYEYTTSFESQNDIVQYTTQGAAYIQYRHNFGEKFVLEPGFRFMYYSSLGEVSPEPRLGIKYNLSSKWRLKAAGGFYSQNLISTKSDQDVVNYFTGFLSGPENSIKDFAGNNSKTNLQKARHLIGGIEADLGNWELTLEPWMKIFDPMININRLRTQISDPLLMLESSEAKGLDFSWKYAFRAIRVQGTYSYMNISRSFTQLDGTEQSYAPPFDRRHNLNIAGSYLFGADKTWMVSGRYTYGSALPFTETQAFYQQYDISGQGAATDLLSGNGNLRIIYNSNLNGGRLSDYARLDISAEKTFHFDQYKNLKLNFSVVNVLNRKNVFYIDRVTNDVVYQLPLLPSIATTFNF